MHKFFFLLTCSKLPYMVSAIIEALVILQQEYIAHFIVKRQCLCWLLLWRSARNYQVYKKICSFFFSTLFEVISRKRVLTGPSQSIRQFKGDNKGMCSRTMQFLDAFITKCQTLQLFQIYMQPHGSFEVSEGLRAVIEQSKKSTFLFSCHCLPLRLWHFQR